MLTKMIQILIKSNKVCVRRFKVDVVYICILKLYFSLYVVYIILTDIRMKLLLLYFNSLLSLHNK